MAARGLSLLFKRLQLISYIISWLPLALALLLKIFEVPQRVYPRVTLGVGGDGFHIRQVFLFPD